MVRGAGVLGMEPAQQGTRKSGGPFFLTKLSEVDGPSDHCSSPWPPLSMASSFHISPDLKTGSQV